MRFGRFSANEARGGVLAHTHRLELPEGRRVLKKGTRIDGEVADALTRGGLPEVWAAIPEPGDVDEDAAAAGIAEVCLGPHLRADTATTGRVNVFATARGRFDADRDAIDEANLLDHRMTLATIEPGRVVEPGDMVATVKIIPFAVREAALDRTRAALGPQPLRLDPLRPLRVGLLLTHLPGVCDAQLDRASESQRRRVERLGGQLRWVRRVPHDTQALAAATGELVDGGAELVLTLGASSMVDDGDILPASIQAAGGRLEQVGMPVDPGNLLVLGSVRGVPTVGVPGCARSPKRNGFDMVLERLFAGREVRAPDIRGMGVGGLLAEIPSRPSPRLGEPSERPARVAAIVLAAGRSTRMGSQNKLLARIDGRPMVTHVVDRLLSCPVDPVLVVVGHEHAAVERALRGRPVKMVDNPDYRDGLSTSVRAGMAELDPTVDGALVALGDMPFIGHATLGHLLAAFDPEADSIVVPVRDGRRGNPVLFSRSFFGAMASLTGDRGAKPIIDAHPDAVVEVSVEEEGVHVDVDTPEALAAVGRRYELETTLSTSSDG